MPQPTVTIKPLHKEPFDDPVTILGKRKLGNEPEYSLLVRFSNGTTQYMPLEMVNNPPNLAGLPVLKGTLER